MSPFRKHATRLSFAVMPLAAALVAAPAAAHTTGADSPAAATAVQTAATGSPKGPTATHTTGADLSGTPAVSAAPSVSAAPATILDCTTWIHNNDPLTGGVDCTNRSAGPVTFHADIICGLAPDVTGDSVTIQPGEVGESSGHCAFYSTGIGGIGWTVE